MIIRIFFLNWIVLGWLFSVALFAESKPTIAFQFSDKYRDYQKAFVNQLLPAAQKANQALENDRAHIQFLNRQFQQDIELAIHDQIWLLKLAETYRIKETTVSENLFAKLLIKVDVIPQELVLAQAAIESAWGKSRFANEGNNFFGVWCYTRGCGIVPSQRPAGQTQEVKRYQNAQESVEHYMLTLNRVRAYKTLRKVRHQLRTEDKNPTGHAMAAGLSKYSAKGWQYVKDVRIIINKYKFELLTP